MACRFLSHRSLLNRDDAPKTLPYANPSICSISADAVQLASQFDMQVLVLIRHPAAFCSSLKIMNWQFDFKNFLRQPLLMEAYLYAYKKEIKEFTQSEKDIIDQSILLWNCIHFTVKKFQERNTDWIFIRHEDISLDPCDQFRLLYEN